MAGWIASLSDQEISNWELCKQHRLFGSGAPRAAGVQVGDTLYFWWSKHGLFARAQASSSVERVNASNFHRIPWPSPEKYKYLMDIDGVTELAIPYTPWKTLDKIAGLRGIPASQFPPVRSESLPSVDALFDVEGAVEYASDAIPGHAQRGTEPMPGVAYKAVPATETSGAAIVFTLDPELQDRGTNGHRLTQNALAFWLTSRGATPLSPDGAPYYDVAWSANGRRYVAEVKSLTPENETHQIRLGLGQVLEYAFQLDAQPVLVLEAEPSSPHWEAVLHAYGVVLIWNGAFDRLEDLLMGLMALPT